MKKSSYMSKSELIDFLKLGCLCGEAAAIAERTTEKEWRQRIKTCVTHLEKVLFERLLCLDRAQLESVDRRKKHTHVILQTEDKSRFKAIEKELVSVDVEDLETLAELALNSCIVCPEGECVKDCRFRLAMHKLCQTAHKVFIDNDIERVRVKRETVGQFTGLRDKNGREVYEEDICRDGKGRIGVVKCFGGTRDMPNGYGGFEQFGLYTQNKDGSWTHFKNTNFYGIEVIGNIYENPELLEGKNEQV